MGVERGDDGVVLLTLNRPEKRNALSLELRDALADALDELIAAPPDEVRCLLVTGAGSAFCSGMDTSEFGGEHAHRERLVTSSERAIGGLARCPIPVVAHLNGPAIAGGFALALLCDVRVADPDATMGFPEVGRRIPPSLAAASSALPPALARRLCLTGEVLSAREALAHGVVSDLGDLAHARALAGRVASAPASATREVKRRALAAAETTWLAALEDEGRVLRETLLGR